MPASQRAGRARLLADVSPEMKPLVHLGFPSSQRLDERLEQLPKRRRVVTVRDSDSKKEESFAFGDVYAMSVTFHHARSIEMNAAYDQLIEIEDSVWLSDIRKRVLSAGGPGGSLRHFRLNLDDGPCYDFISGSYEHSKREG